MEATATILVVSDDRGTASCLTEELRNRGFAHVRQCEATEFAFAQAIGRRPNLVLAACAATDFDGLRALRQLRASDSDTPVVVVAPALDDHTRVRFRYDGTARVATGDLSGLAFAIERGLEWGRAREQARRVASAQQRSVDQYSAVFRLSTSAIILTDVRSGRFTDVNDSFCSLTGYQREESVGRTSAELGLWVESEQRRSVQEMLQAGRPVQAVELTLRRKDGSTCAVLASFDLVNLGGEPAILSLVHDISDRQRLQATLQRQNDYLTALHETSLALLDRRDVSDLLQQIVTQATSLVSASGGLINVVEPGGNSLLTMAATGALAGRIGMRLQPGQGVAGRVWQSGTTYAVEDYGTAPERLDGVDLPIATVGVPLSVKRHVTGVLLVTRHAAESPFTSDEVVLLERFGHLAALALDNARLDAEARSELAERVRAESQTRASEARFRALVENAADIIAVLAPDGTVQHISPAIERVLGYTADALQGNNAFVLVHPDDVDQCRRSFGNVLQHAGPYPYPPLEFRIRHASGNWRWIEARSNNLLHEASVHGIVLNVRDITERRRAEAERAALAAIVESSNDAIVGLSLKGVITSWNAGAERLYGYTAGEAVGQSAIMLVPPDHTEETRPLLALTRRGERVQEYETRRLAKSGTVVDVSLSLSPVYDSAGRHIGVSSIARDIGERHRGELALRESEARYRQLFEGHQAITLIWDPATDAVIDANPAACAFYGYSRAAMQRLQMADVNASTEADRAAEHALAVAERRPFLRFRNRLASGEVRDVEVYSSSVTVEGRQLRYAIVHDVTERLAAERQLAYLAYHDPLTGLANRTRFLASLQERQERLSSANGPTGLAVLFVDLDGFKLVNDSLGHDVGDELLVAVSRRLRAATRATHLLARFGGDEFTLALTGLADPAAAVEFAEHILDAIRRPFTLRGRRRYVTASIGIAFRLNDEPARPEDLVREADIALYQAKMAGKSRAAVYTPSMSASVRERLELETDLRQALKRGELRLHYQPEVDLSTGAVVGLEALVRWQHPRRGLLAPASFIPVAEDTDLILPLGMWVLREACRQAKVWASLRPAGRAPVMSVNLSARQLHHPGLVAEVAGVLRETGLDPAGLRLELTETVVMQHVQQTLGVLAALRELGVLLAIDDFGTGYSSLEYLARLPVTTVKVDRSFVQRMGEDTRTAAIVDATIALAHALGLDVTAEGIEEAGQLARLRRLGCERGQGYYFARPLVPEAIPGLLNDGAFRLLLRSA